MGDDGVICIDDDDDDGIICIDNDNDDEIVQTIPIYQNSIDDTFPNIKNGEIQPINLIDDFDVMDMGETDVSYLYKFIAIYQYFYDKHKIIFLY